MTARMAGDACICLGLCNEDECPICLAIDPYAPCPAIGYGCGLLEEEPCDCCTPEQRRMAAGKDPLAAALADPEGRALVQAIHDRKAEA